MSTIDDLLKWDDNEKELDLDNALRPLPVGKWLVLQAKGADEGGASALDPPDPQYNRNFYRLRLGLRVVGGEEDVPAGAYQSVFHRVGIDSKDNPGIPGPLLKSMINTFFGSGLPHNSPERTAESNRVLKETIEELGMNPELLDDAGQPVYPNKAVFLAAVFAAALGKFKPTVLVKPYLQKAKAYVDKQGNQAMTKETVAVGGWTDCTPGTCEEKGVKVWGFADEASGVSI